jgi:urease accessory protein
MDTRTERDPSGGALPAWLPALLQLASPTLPIGAFSYSQGLESACAEGVVGDEASALAWIGSQWESVFAVRELPALDAAWRAFGRGDREAFAAEDSAFIASRDSAEARAETVQTGAALLRWLANLQPECAELAFARAAAARPGAPAAFALCAHSQGLGREAAAFAWGFAWIENQVQAAVKLVPLGQSAGQRMLVALRARLFEPPPATPWSFAPIASIMSMRHERLYSRLFRS